MCQRLTLALNPGTVEVDMATPKPPELSQCVFSDDRVFRYRLTHSWRSPDLPLYVPSKRAIWIGVNPSRANESALDNTLRRVKAFSRAWGCDAFTMVNLFAFVSPFPKDLLTAADPIGPDNDRHIAECARLEDTTHVVAMWGCHGRLRDRDRQVMDLLASKLSSLGVNRDGTPKHVLYLPNGTSLQPFPAAAPAAQCDSRLTVPPNPSTLSLIT